MNDQQKNIINDIKEIERKISTIPATYLCTDDCKCPQSNSSNNWLPQYQTSDLEKRANSLNRTVYAVPKVGMKNFVFAANSETAITNFLDCQIKLQNSQQSSTASPSAKQFEAAKDGLKDFAKAVEDTFMCNGICSPGLFYYVKPVTDGAPTKNCVDGVTEMFKGKPLGIGILLLISFVLTVITHMISWSMCCRCCGPKEKKDEWK